MTNQEAINHPVYMSPEANQLLRRLAKRYVWWKTPEESLTMPRRLIAQVMNLGEFGDVSELAQTLGDEDLLDALIHAEPGQFCERSWEYWHYRLGLAEPDKVPALPRRAFA